MLLNSCQTETKGLVYEASGRATCPKGSTMSEADTSAVRSALDEFLTALVQRDWERFRRCFASDATVFFPWDLYPRRADGKTEVEAEWKRFFDETPASPPYLTLVPLDVAIQVWLDVALVTCHLENHPPTISRRTFVFHRHGPQWRLVHLHASGIKVPNT